MQLRIGSIFYILLLIAEISYYFTLQGLALSLVAISQVVTFCVGLFHIQNLDWTIIFYIDAETQKKERIVVELWEEALLVTACVLLITLGVLTDLVSVFLLFEPSRKWILKTFFYNAY